ncbi:hypothetical protein Q4610_15500 [Sphingobium sp. HBC34]|uniref:Uncharacterized protein n=1 Tax=Sphingobium cyanobacteriorum TaxID=3063954 RepID=A0ABT8ZQU0_9SPHN|nr:hypothetical protein [Sphingobium sp. HBC34]MDO7836453.1 hypothetical protein [Sphingobium sp. HBC34]
MDAADAIGVILGRLSAKGHLAGLGALDGYPHHFPDTRRLDAAVDDAAESVQTVCDFHCGACSKIYACTPQTRHENRVYSNTQLKVAKVIAGCESRPAHICRIGHRIAQGQWPFCL